MNYYCWHSLRMVFLVSTAAQYLLHSPVGGWQSGHECSVCNAWMQCCHSYSVMSILIFNCWGENAHSRRGVPFAQGSLPLCWLVGHCVLLTDRHYTFNWSTSSKLYEQNRAPLRASAFLPQLKNESRCSNKGFKLGLDSPLWCSPNNHVRLEWKAISVYNIKRWFEKDFRTTTHPKDYALPWLHKNNDIPVDVM